MGNTPLTRQLKVEGATASLAFALGDWQLDLSIQTAAPFQVQVRQGQGPQPAFWSMEDNGGWQRHRFYGREVLGAAVEEWRQQLRPVWTEHQSMGFIVGLHMFAGRALRACAPGPRRLARALNPRLRFLAYQLLCEDPTGRLAQLRAASPGGFVLLCALLGRAWTAPLGEQLRREVVSGRKLNHALRGALAGLDPRVDPRGLETWLALVRRAPPSLYPGGVSVAPPEGTALEDLPAHPATRRCWLDVVAWLGAVLAEGPAHAADRSVAEFVSRHGTLVGRWLHRRQRDLRDLVAYVRNTGRVVGRGVAPQPVLQDFGRWTEPLTLFPAAPLPEVRSAEVRLEHVPDRQALADAARSFHNCARRLARSAELGFVAVYVGAVAGRRVMVALAEERGRWRVEQVRGTVNRLPTEEEQAAVERWVVASQPRPR